MEDNKLQQIVKVLEEKGYSADDMFGLLEGSDPLEVAMRAAPGNLWGGLIQIARPDIDVEELSSAAEEIDNLFSELYDISERI